VRAEQSRFATAATAHALQSPDSVARFLCLMCLSAQKSPQSWGVQTCLEFDLCRPGSGALRPFRDPCGAGGRRRGSPPPTALLVVSVRCWLSALSKFELVLHRECRDLDDLFSVAFGDCRSRYYRLALSRTDIALARHAPASIRHDNLGKRSQLASPRLLAVRSRAWADTPW
jgi:hypothetical protein